ncbi:MAG TPA: hypothetical protein VIH61_07695, partial [Waddliaceae bacterium]
RFNIDGSYPFLHHLKANIIGRWNTWGIQWYASVILANGLGLFPSKSLTSHVGFGKDSTHAKNSEGPIGKISNEPITLTRIKIEESVIARKAFKNYYLHLEKNLIKRHFNLFKENIKRIYFIKYTFNFLRAKLYNERNAV